MRSYQNVLLDPRQCVVALIDFQPQMFFAVESHSRKELQNNVVGFAKACKVFNVPVILTTIQAKQFTGSMINELQNVFPGIVPIDRSNMNAWEDENFRSAIRATGCKKIIIAGITTGVCALFPAISMKADDYDVYVVADACGDMAKKNHETAMERMIQACIVPVTWLQIMAEWQRDYGNTGTYPGYRAVIREHGGAMGLGIEYANEIFSTNNTASNNNTNNAFESAKDLPPSDYLAIQKLLSNYWEAVDYSDIETFANLFTIDGILENYTGITYGRDNLKAWLNNYTVHIGNRHFTVNPIITKVDCYTAQVWSYMIVLATSAPKLNVPWLSTFAQFDDIVTKVNGQWLFKKRLMSDASSHEF